MVSTTCGTSHRREHIEVFRRNGFDFVDSATGKPPASSTAKQASTAQQEAQQGQGPEEQGQDAMGWEDGEKAGAAMDLELPAPGDPWTAAPVDSSTMGGDGGEDGAYSGGDVQGQLLLSSVPFSKGTTFGVDDVAEMVAALRAGEHPETLRPSRWVGWVGRWWVLGAGWAGCLVQILISALLMMPAHCTSSHGATVLVCCFGGMRAWLACSCSCLTFWFWWWIL